MWHIILPDVHRVIKNHQRLPKDFNKYVPKEYVLIFSRLEI